MATTSPRETSAEQDAAETIVWRSKGVRGVLQDLFWPRPAKPHDLPERPQRRPDVEIRDAVEKHVDATELDVVLAEALSIYETRDARLARIESRATSLQATVGIATTLTLAAAAVLLDSNKVDDVWRKVLAVVVAGLVFSLVMAGWHATRVTLKRFERGRIASREAVRRMIDTKGVEAHQRGRVIDLLIAARRNADIDLQRSAILRGARRWYYSALALILVVAILIAAYALFGPVPTASDSSAA